MLLVRAGEETTRVDRAEYRELSTFRHRFSSSFVSSRRENVSSVNSGKRNQLCRLIHFTLCRHTVISVSFNGLEYVLTYESFLSLKRTCVGG
jgi:hypothetical protein